MEIRIAMLVAAMTLITAAPATAFTWPGNVLRLADRFSAHTAITQEPQRPEWPAQYQVRSFTQLRLIWLCGHVDQQCLLEVVQVLC